MLSIKRALELSDASLKESPARIMEISTWRSFGLLLQ